MGDRRVKQHITITTTLAPAGLDLHSAASPLHSDPCCGRYAIKIESAQ
jgi:hypothetical protein